jgi:hypothetical protein
MQQELAETVALRALAWLVADAELLPVFTGSTGASEADLRERACDPDFLAATLDFLLLDDAWLGRFAAEAGLDPQTVARARAALPGGEAPHWT